MISEETFILQNACIDLFNDKQFYIPEPRAKIKKGRKKKNTVKDEAYLTCMICLQKFPVKGDELKLYCEECIGEV